MMKKLVEIYGRNPIKVYRMWTENMYGTSIVRRHSLEPKVWTLTVALRDLYKSRLVPKKKIKKKQRR